MKVGSKFKYEYKNSVLDCILISVAGLNDDAPYGVVDLKTFTVIRCFKKIGDIKVYNFVNALASLIMKYQAEGESLEVDICLNDDDSHTCSLSYYNILISSESVIFEQDLNNEEYAKFLGLCRAFDIKF